MRAVGGRQVISKSTDSRRVEEVEAKRERAEQKRLTTRRREKGRKRAGELPKRRKK